MHDCACEAAQERGYETNTELLQRVMEQGCPTGHLIQIFVIDALIKQCDRVLADRAETLRQMEHGFVNGEAWIRTAEWLKQQLDAHGR